VSLRGSGDLFLYAGLPPGALLFRRLRRLVLGIITARATPLTYHLHRAQESNSRVGLCFSRSRLRSQFKLLEIGAKVCAEIFALEREFYRGLQEAELVAGIVALAFENIAVYFFAFEQQP
jgi:hypothetical protein